MRWISRFLLFVVTFGASALLFAAEPSFPALTGPVVDDAGLLPAAVQQSLSEKLAGYARGSNGMQVVVATLKSTDGLTIEQYGYQLGRHWGIGQKGKDNGVLLIVVPSQKKVRIEVGYGLEGTLTDALSANIISQIILPAFRQGQFAQGIVAGADAIMQVLGGSYVPRKAERRQHQSSWGGLLFLIMLGFAVLPWLFGGGRRGPGGRFYRRGPGLGTGLLVGSLLGGGFGGRGGFGGGGGGGGGGFGGGGFGGGGGSFGGGGASGGW